MKRLLIVICLTSSFYAYAQKEWAPIGAKWYYNQPSSEYTNFVVFESKRDSIIQGKDVRIIEVKLNGTSLISNEYINQNGDSILYFNTSTNKFHLLYNFSANEGDTIVVHNEKFKPTKAFFSYNDSIDFFKYKVISIDSIQLSGEWFRRQKVENLGNSSWGFIKPTGGSNDYIINSIGSITYFYGVFPVSNPEQNSSILRCYLEPGLEYKDPLWNQPCDIITDLHDKIPGSYAYQVYPNPCKEQLFISMPEPIVSIEVYDLNGLKVLFAAENDKAICLDTSTLRQGFYLVRIKTGNNIYEQKIIKK